MTTTLDPVVSRAHRMRDLVRAEACSFGSGTGHSEYVVAGFIPLDNGEMRWISEGTPRVVCGDLSTTLCDVVH